MSWRRLTIALLLAPPLGLGALGVLFLLAGGLLPMVAVLAGIGAVTGMAMVSPAGGAAVGLPTTFRPQIGPSLAARAGCSPGPGASPARVRRHVLRAGGLAAIWTAGIVLVLSGLVAAVGAATVPLLLAAGIITAGVAWVRRREQLDDPPTLVLEPGSPDGDRPLARVLEPLSTRELCTEWRRSLRALDESTDPASREDIAHLRRRYLDEIERRDPDALARWLALDERPAGSDLGRHLSDAGGTTASQDDTGEARGPDGQAA